MPVYHIGKLAISPLPHAARLTVLEKCGDVLHWQHSEDGPDQRNSSLSSETRRDPSTAADLVPVVQGHGWQNPRSVLLAKTVTAKAVEPSNPNSKADRKVHFY